VRHGSAILLAVGIVLIGLATWQATHEAVASVFAFGGIAAAVLSVLIERIEGAFEFTPTGLKATLSALRRVEEREDLTLEEKADEILALVAAMSKPEMDRTAAPEMPSTQAQAATGTIFPTFDVYVVDADAHASGLRFEQFVRDAFIANGWHVNARQHVAGYEVDLVARRESLTLFIETKLRRSKIGMADAAQFVAKTRSSGDRQAQWALVLPAGGLTSAAQTLLASVATLHVLEVPVVWN
jgi:hypothetical protein